MSASPPGSAAVNIDEAIRAHTFWKVTLRWLVNGRQKVDADMLGDDHACELGRWMDAEQAELARYPAYSDLCRIHAEFHRVAGEIARLALGGQTEEAARMLAPGSAFSRASEGIIAALKALREQMASPSET